MARRTFLIGLGCTPFIKPRGTRTTESLGLEAVTKALLDAGITYDAIDTAAVGYCYGDSTSGQRALYALGLTGIPIVNVNNNCSTGSTALYLANNAVRGEQAECALALGFERMAPGSLGTVFRDRPSPMGLFAQRVHEIEDSSLGANKGPPAPREFDNAAREYFAHHGVGEGAGKRVLAKIAAKNHRHAINNPYAQFRNGWGEEEILNATPITATLTKYMCSPTSDGAACCIVASEAFVHAHHLENQAIEIVAQGLNTDAPSAFEKTTWGAGDDSGPAMDLVGYGMTKACADKVFADAGASRAEVGVVELHDCFAANELITYPALGLCAPGEAHKGVEGGAFEHVNPSGGLEAKGHPLGATGLAMCFYVGMQLRNWAGPMQVPGLFNTKDPRGKYGLVHNIGLGGAVVVTLLRRPEFYEDGKKTEDGRDRLAYNHAHIARPITRADVDKVRSKNAPSNYVLEYTTIGWEEGKEAKL
ncbi:thiolase-like protein [Schizophyllum commune Tattone D]|nr:thiolase-like protein [Schizophyllum commune Tattone D]